MGEPARPLARGQLLSHYELLEPVGRGAMGEVWRARDLRLGRDVALKVLLAEAGRDGLAAIEREARAASSLSHPNLVTLFEVDTDSTPPFLAMELVDGTSLADLAAEGALPAGRALHVAAQVADGLAAAHESGLVHRDLKPGNVMLTRTGTAKILDFGLARRTRPAVASPADRTLPDADRTSPGALVGTASYMSPEQAAGRTADFRSDQFALGVVLYELLSGGRAFRRDTAVETLAAVLRDEPEPLPQLPASVDGAVRTLLARCLAKDPAERYAATRDLALDLRALAHRASLGSGDPISPKGPASASEGAGRGPASRAVRLLTPARAGAALAAALLVAGAFAVGVAASGRIRPASPPAFRQLTFLRGTLFSARFTPGGEGLVYGASWEGARPHVYTARTEGGASALLLPRDANLLAVSPKAEAALSLDARPVLASLTVGTLARMPLAGGAPRDLLEAVDFADFGPEGGEPFVVRRSEGKGRLEAPGGGVLFETPGWIGNPRVSRDGLRVAFVHHPVFGDDRGDIVVVPAAGGSAKVLSGGWIGAVGLAWSASGSEVWFSATASAGGRSLFAVDLSGRRRAVYGMPGDFTLHDVSAAGAVLATHDKLRIGAMRGDASGESDVSWLDSSLLSDLSADGRSLLFTEFGEGGGPLYSAYLRGADGSSTRLGDGLATSLSPDGRSVLSILPKEEPVLLSLPTRSGAAKPIPVAPLSALNWATWFPDGRRVLVVGSEKDGGLRLWRLDPGAPARPLGEAGVFFRYAGGIVSPDGATVAYCMEDGRLLAVAATGGPARLLWQGPPGVVPVAFTGDGLAVFALDGEQARVHRVEVATGRAMVARELRPIDPAGVIGIPTFRTTGDGSPFVYSYARLLSELYLVEGLR